MPNAKTYLCAIIKQSMSCMKWSEVKFTQSCPTLFDPMDLYSPWNSPGQNTGVFFRSHSPGHNPNPGIKPRSPTLQADSLPAEPQGKPLLTGCEINFILFSAAYFCISKKAMAPHFSTLAWKIPWTEEPGRLQSRGLLGVGHDWTTLLWLFDFLIWISQ